MCRQGDRSRWEAAGRREPVVDVAPARRPLRLAWEQAALPRLAQPPAGRRPPRAALHDAAGCSDRPTVVTVHDLSFFSHPEWHQPSKVAFFRGAIRVGRGPGRGHRRRQPGHRRPPGRTRPAAGAGARHPPRRRPRPLPPGAGPTRRRRRRPGRGWASSRAGPTSPSSAPSSPARTCRRWSGPSTSCAGGHPDLDPRAGRQPGLGRGRGRAGASSPPGRATASRLTGYVTEDENVALLRGAAVVAYPSLEEGFGLPALETMACGTPAGDDVGLGHGGGGAAAPCWWRRATSAGWPRPSRRRLAGGADVERAALGLEVAGRHTWGATAAAHVEVYRSVVVRRRTWLGSTGCGACSGGAAARGTARRG